MVHPECAGEAEVDRYPSWVKRGGPGPGRRRSGTDGTVSVWGCWGWEVRVLRARAR